MEGGALVAKYLIIYIESHLLLVEGNDYFDARDVGRLDATAKGWELKDYLGFSIFFCELYFTNRFVSQLHKKVFLYFSLFLRIILKAEIIFTKLHERVRFQI